MIIKGPDNQAQNLTYQINQYLSEILIVYLVPADIRTRNDDCTLSRSSFWAASLLVGLCAVHEAGCIAKLIDLVHGDVQNARELFRTQSSASGKELHLALKNRASGYGSVLLRRLTAAHQNEGELLFGGGRCS